MKSLVGSVAVRCPLRASTALVYSKAHATHLPWVPRETLVHLLGVLQNSEHNSLEKTLGKKDSVCTLKDAVTRPREGQSLRAQKHCPCLSEAGPPSRLRPVSRAVVVGLFLYYAL